MGYIAFTMNGQLLCHTQFYEKYIQNDAIEIEVPDFLYMSVDDFMYKIGGNHITDCDEAEIGIFKENTIEKYYCEDLKSDPLIFKKAI